MKWFDMKYSSTEDVDEAHLLMGRLPYGSDGFYVKASSKLGNPVLWTHLMSVGGTFSGTDYVVVRASTTEELVEQVTAASEDMCLHGTPFTQKDAWCQVLVAWDPNVSMARRRQLFGCLLTLKYKHYDEVDADAEPKEEPEPEPEPDEDADEEPDGDAEEEPEPKP
jgi:hypothetical protein